MAAEGAGPRCLDGSAGPAGQQKGIKFAGRARRSALSLTGSRHPDVTQTGGLGDRSGPDHAKRTPGLPVPGQFGRRGLFEIPAGGLRRPGRLLPFGRGSAAGAVPALPSRGAAGEGGGGAGPATEGCRGDAPAGRPVPARAPPGLPVSGPGAGHAGRPVHDAGHDAHHGGVWTADDGPGHRPGARADLSGAHVRHHPNPAPDHPAGGGPAAGGDDHGGTERGDGRASRPWASGP